MGRNGTDTGGSPRADASSERDTDVLVIGAGQAGLGTAYWLARHGGDGGGLRTLVLDAAPIGQSWIQRWDSLTLFTPRRFSGLPGWGFPRGWGGHPSRTEMAAYIRDYTLLGSRQSLRPATAERAKAPRSERLPTLDEAAELVSRLFVCRVNDGPAHAPRRSRGTNQSSASTYSAFEVPLASRRSVVSSPTSSRSANST